MVQSPLSKSVKSNIGKIFLNLIKRYFPKINKLHKIFNKNTVKISYSCMSNMSSILSSHNLNVNNSYKTQAYGYKCRIKESFPLQNQCLIPKIIYWADVENDINNESKFYFGLTKTPFKERFGNHTRDFKPKRYSISTERSKYIWDLIETEINPIVKWFIVEKIYRYTKIKYCNFCLLEKLYIIDFIDHNCLLNKRNKFISGFKHQNKLLLENVKWHRALIGNLNCFWHTHDRIF